MNFYFIDRGQEVPLFLCSHTLDEARAEREQKSAMFDTVGTLVEFRIRDVESFVCELYSMDCDIIEAIQVWYTEKTELSFGGFDIVDYPSMSNIIVTEKTASSVRKGIRRILYIYGWTKESEEVTVESDGIHIGGNVDGWISFGDKVMYLGFGSGAVIKMQNGEFFSIQSDTISVYSFDGDEYTDSFYLEKKEVYPDED